MKQRKPDKFKMVKVGDNFWKELKDIQAKRTMGVDNGTPLNLERITNAFLKTRLWKPVKDEVTHMPKAEDVE